MRIPILNLIAIIALASGTLVCAAEPQPTQAPADGNKRTLTVQLDRWIAAKLEPALDETPRQTQTADGTIHLHAWVRPVKTTRPQAPAEAPATQPAQEFFLDIGVNAADVRRVYDVGQLVTEVGQLNQPSQKAAEEAVASDLEDATRLTLLSIANEQAKADGAYLGVGVESPDETLRAQLGLAPSAGLVINFVDENGPAKAAIQPHDVLEKLDDQLLINGDQLVALVRMRKPGETVSLTLLRRAKPVTVQVELGQRKPAKAEEHSSAGNAGWNATQPAYAWFVSPGNVQDYSHLYGTFTNPNHDLLASPATDQIYSNAYSQLSGSINLANYWKWQARLDQRPITFNDGELLATFGKGELLAVDLKDGKVIYHGPIGTESQWNAMPKLLQEKLSSWRSIVSPAATRPAAPAKPDPSGK